MCPSHVGGISLPFLFLPPASCICYPSFGAALALFHRNRTAVHYIHPIISSPRAIAFSPSLNSSTPSVGFNIMPYRNGHVTSFHSTCTSILYSIYCPGRVTSITVPTTKNQSARGEDDLWCVSRSRPMWPSMSGDMRRKCLGRNSCSIFRSFFVSSLKYAS